MSGGHDTNESSAQAARETLDPTDWTAFRAQAHAMLDDILDFTRDVRERPVWTAAPAAVRDSFRAPLPRQSEALADVHRSFMTDILPYTGGNTHPGFMGWVQGGGTPVGTLAEMLAAGLNANLGGRDQIPLEVERQVLHWMRELFEFPATASGLFVTGTSMANLMALLVARTAKLGADVRTDGVAAAQRPLVAYTSAGAHQCIAQAMDLAGLGKAALRLVPTTARCQIDLAALECAIARDRAAGLEPFFVAGTAGTVDVGAVDDLAALGALARREALWFHVDGAYGALGMLAPAVAPLLEGIQQADSIAFDFHKWGQVPYDAGFLLVRDGQQHLDTFASPAAYLRRESRGLSAGSPWPCDFGPDLSRGFRALKTWFTFKVHGADRIGRAIAHTCELAQYLKRRIEEEPRLELLAPVALNVVCFRYRCDRPDEVNAEIVVAVQESGLAVPSSTTLGGRFAIRAAIVNHRTEKADIDVLIGATLRFGAQFATQSATQSALKEAVNAAPELAPTRRLLLGGGDERLDLQAGDGLNKYGCGPVADPVLAAFGSCTATSISEPGFAAADGLRDALLPRLDAQGGARCHVREAERIRAELKQLCGVADMPGLEVVLAASGTDLHLIAAQWIASAGSRRPLVIMMGASETGSGVAAALSGRHFGQRSALGCPVAKGEAIDGGQGAQVVQVEVRLADGQARPSLDVQAEIDALATQAAHADRRVLLVTLDVSKTGLLVPAPDFVAALHGRLAPRLDVLVDACQFRLSSATLRRYLEAGFLVATTGSKFVTGPSFCGALFVAPQVAQRLSACRLPRALSAYSARGDWPSAWNTAARFDDVGNLGLLLRWQAALAELRAFAQVDAGAARRFADAFASAVRERIHALPALQLLSVPALDRGPFADAGSWDEVATIFPFVLHRRGARGARLPLTRAQTLAVYKQLPGAPDFAWGPPGGPAAAAPSLRCQLGQPVECGGRDGVPVSALRLCLSSRLIVEATARGGEKADVVIRRALATLDKTAWLVDALHPSTIDAHHAQDHPSSESSAEPA